jgi:hypothetical protein
VCAGDGTRKEVGIKNRSVEEIREVLESLKTVTAGTRYFKKPVVSRVPSIQGPWDPSVSFDGVTIREAKPLA